MARYIYLLTLIIFCLQALLLSKSKERKLRVRCPGAQQGLSPDLVSKIQVAAVQAVRSYGAELSWYGQAIHDHQGLVNSQARTITGMFKTSPIEIVARESSLRPALALLNNRKGQYTLRLLCLLRSNPDKHILLLSFHQEVVPLSNNFAVTNDDWRYQQNRILLGTRLAACIAAFAQLDLECFVNY